MRRLLAWLGGAAGGLLAYRAFARRRPLPQGAGEATIATAGADPRAEELRSRIARAHEEEPALETPAEAGDEPDERRRAVHEHGRAAIDRMRAASDDG